jgi:formate hydrogenlyase transcriptional activator
MSSLRLRACRRLAHAARVRELEHELAQQALVLRINNLLATHLEPEALFEAISSVLWEQVHHHFMALSLLEEGGTRERLHFLDTPGEKSGFTDPVVGPLDLMPSGRAIRRGRIEVLGQAEIAASSPAVRDALGREGIRSMCCVPLAARGEVLGSLSLGSRRPDGFTPGAVALLRQVAPQAAIALSNALAYREIRLLKDKLAEEKLYLEEEARQDFATGEIIGTSPALLRVIRHVETVAPSDATVLLLGETGTGKELVARAIHERSRRAARTFVRLNCSAIPLGLMESELFGHERGAFTGAIAPKPGRFELANQGTLFLDEIGDLPLEVQPKLLRAIQEREFERLGSNRTIGVDVRLVAATHRDLAAMVAEGSFRSDLFYRLNVFPIRVPPLRERREDIPSLVRYFTQKYAKAMDRRIESIPASAMEALVAWSWPGNIRELQNLVERSVILSKGSELRVPLGELTPLPDVADAPQTLEAHERQQILKALQECRGVVGGPKGAAERLGLKRTTLHSRMKKLGISRA